MVHAFWFTGYEQQSWKRYSHRFATMCRFIYKNANRLCELLKYVNINVLWAVRKTKVLLRGLVIDNRVAFCVKRKSYMKIKAVEFLENKIIFIFSFLSYSNFCHFYKLELSKNARTLYLRKQITQAP